MTKKKMEIKKQDMTKNKLHIKHSYYKLEKSWKKY